MKNHILHLSLIMTALIAINFGIKAQPSSTPAVGYSWVLTGTSTYNSSEVSTIPTSPGDTSYGQSGDSDPSSCSSSCSGNCDGNPYIRKKVFGSTPGYSDASCEQRAINLNHWNNPFPNSGVPNGATAGTVYLPISANVNIIQSPNNGSPGTGAGGDENYGWIIGGWGAPNQSLFNVSVNWSLAWSSTALGGFSGSQTRQNDGSFMAVDPGGSTEQQISGGWINGGLGFGETFSETFSIPVNNLPQSSGTFEVKFVADATISISRVWGNADGMAQHGPGMEGRASHNVTYQVWQIQPTLPVTLSSFQGKSEKQGITLWWTAESAYNFDYYEIERSKNNLDWTTLGKISLNSNGKYSFFDSKPFYAENYYRLKKVDNDGNYQYSDIIQVAQKSQNIVVFPNPTSNDILVEGWEELGITNVVVENMLGKQILNHTAQKNISLQNIPSGVYIVKFLNQNNDVISSQKLQKL